MSEPGISFAQIICNPKTSTPISSVAEREQKQHITTEIGQICRTFDPFMARQFISFGLGSIPHNIHEIKLIWGSPVLLAA